MHLDAKHVSDLTNRKLRVFEELGIGHRELQRLKLKTHREQTDPVGVFQTACHLLETLAKPPLGLLVKIANVVDDAPSLQSMLVKVMQVPRGAGAALHQKPQVIDGVNAHNAVNCQPLKMQHLVGIKAAPLTAHSDDIPDFVSSADEPLVINPNLDFTRVNRPKRLDPTLVRSPRLKLDGYKRVAPQGPLRFDGPPEIVGRHVRVGPVFEQWV